MSESAQLVQPHSDESERAILGAMMLQPDTVIPLARVKYRVAPEAFYIPWHRALFELICGLADKGRSVDLLSVCETARVTGMVESCGGESFIEGCIDVCPTAAHADYYLDTIRQRWIQRGIIHRGKKLVQEAYEAERGEDLLAVAPQRFADIVDAVVVEPDNGALMDASVQKWEDAKAFQEGDASKRPAVGISTPWKIITELLCGLEPGLIVLGGRPSAGKTTMEDMLAIHAAEAGVAVARGTLDTTHQQLLERTLCRKAGVSLPKLKFGFAGRSQLASCRQARDHIAKLPIFINENLTYVEEFCSWVKMMKARRNIGLATFDYVQLLRPQTGSSFLQDNENARGEYISSMLKRLGNELKIPIVALSQLNRMVEKDNRNPNMSDLRGSGGLEQAADKVVFLYKDKEKATEMDEKSHGATKHKRPVWFDVVKHKNGECGMIPMWLHAPYFRFEIAASVNGIDFTDDDMPADRQENDRTYAHHPEIEPSDEERGLNYEGPAAE